MRADSDRFTISALASRAGVNIETIRYYQRRRLLGEPAKPLGGVRHYCQADVQRVRFIKSAQKLGFTLEEIADLLRLDDGMHCAEARSIAQHKLGDVRGKLADLRRMESLLAKLIEACGKGDPIACPLIEALHGASHALDHPRRQT